MKLCFTTVLLGLGCLALRQVVVTRNTAGMRILLLLAFVILVVLPLLAALL